MHNYTDRLLKVVLQESQVCYIQSKYMTDHKRETDQYTFLWKTLQVSLRQK